MKNNLDFFATCAKNISNLLEKELVDLGAKKTKQTTFGVEFIGDLSLAYRVCLWSRLANRVLLKLATSNGEDAAALYDGVSKIDWQDHLTTNGSLVVDFSGTSNAINNSQFGALKVKDAIVDQFRKKFGKRPDVDKNNPDLRVNVYLHQGIATISIDLSGASLHRRGYRKNPGIAPLKETLAAAILYRCDWPNQFKNKPLLDCMCGSGTILIEAAMIAQDCAPGLFRTEFGFSRWPNHNTNLWSTLIEEAKTRYNHGQKNFDTPIYGSDIDEENVNLANQCIKTAGFEHRIKVLVKDARNISPEEYGINHSGIIIINPPYGNRLQNHCPLDLFYKSFGECLRKNFINWELAIFTGDIESCKKLFIRPRRQYNFFNGIIPCKLLFFDIKKESFWKECLGE